MTTCTPEGADRRLDGCAGLTRKSPAGNERPERAADDSGAQLGREAGRLQLRAFEPGQVLALARSRRLAVLVC